MLKSFFNLQFFAEEADSSFATSAADTSTTIGSDASASMMTPDASDDSQSPAEMDTESFESLIEGKYKADYDKMVKARVKEAISKRFKNQDDYKAKYEGLNPLLSQMAMKYGLDPNNIDHEALTNAIANDNSLYEQEAFEKGIDVDTLKQIKSLERENARLKGIEDARVRDEESREAFNQLVSQGEELKKTYPQFNLDDEMMNPDFGRLLANNVPMKTAYEVIHKDEILTSGMAYAVQKTAANISSSIASGLSRPSENGMSSQAAASAGQLDPSKLSLKDFAALKARAERGEKIYFN